MCKRQCSLSRVEPFFANMYLNTFSDQTRHLIQYVGLRKSHYMFPFHPLQVSPLHSQSVPPYVNTSIPLHSCIIHPFRHPQASPLHNQSQTPSINTPMALRSPFLNSLYKPFVPPYNFPSITYPFHHP